MTFHFITTAQSIDNFSINPTGSHLEGGSISINFNISWVSKIDYENDFVITDFLLPIDLSLEVVSSVQSDFNKNIKIYPNPFINFIWIETKQPITDIQIINLNGSVILIPEVLNTIDTSKIQTGMYIMTITLIDYTQIKYKIVKL